MRSNPRSPLTQGADLRAAGILAAQARVFEEL